MERTEKIDELVWRNRAHYANFQLAASELREIPCQALGLIRVLEDVLEVWPDHPTQFGEMRVCSLAMKQWPSEFGFQQLDRARQRRLRDVAPFSCLGEVQLVRNSQKISDLMHLHGITLSVDKPSGAPDAVACPAAEGMLYENLAICNAASTVVPATSGEKVTLRW